MEEVGLRPHWPRCSKRAGREGRPWREPLARSIFIWAQAPKDAGLSTMGRSRSVEDAHGAGWGCPPLPLGRRGPSLSPFCHGPADPPAILGVGRGSTGATCSAFPRPAASIARAQENEVRRRRRSTPHSWSARRPQRAAGDRSRYERRSLFGEPNERPL